MTLNAAIQQISSHAIHAHLENYRSHEKDLNKSELSFQLSDIPTLTEILVVLSDNHYWRWFRGCLFFFGRQRILMFFFYTLMVSVVKTAILPDAIDIFICTYFIVLFLFTEKTISYWVTMLP